MAQRIDGGSSNETMAVAAKYWVQYWDGASAYGNDDPTYTFSANAFDGSALGGLYDADQSDYTIAASTTLTITTAGDYAFASGGDADDMVRIYVDGVFITKNTGAGTSAPAVDVTLSIGTHDIKIVYTQGGGPHYTNGGITVNGPDTGDVAINLDDAAILASDGDDELHGGGGNDQLRGGADDDAIYGDAGDDTLYGGVGNDTIDGGSDDDTLYGGDGDDTIYGGDASTGTTTNVVATETFASGTEGWTTVGGGALSANESAGGDAFLGRFAGTATLEEQIQETYNLDTAATSLTLEFDFLKIDSWDADFQNEHEQFGVYIDGVLAFTFEPEGAAASNVMGGGNDAGSGAFAGGTWVITSSGSDIDLGFSKANSSGGERYYHVEITLDDPGATVTLGVGAESNSLINDESFGIDNVVVTETFAATTESGGNDVLSGGTGDDTLDGGDGDDSLTGGDDDDVFIETSGDGSDLITDFGIGNTGATDDGDQTNNDHVDLSAFYNSTTLAAVNSAGGSFNTELGMLQADQADGVLDGVIGGVDYSAQIGDIDLTIENGGSAVSSSALTYDTTNVACFTAGTLIKTMRGEVPIEGLEAGDLVLTQDKGYQPIRWIGGSELSDSILAENSKLRPIRIKAGALGLDLPHQDLLVSPQHRMLVCSEIANRMFGTREVLIPANKLVPLDGVDVDQNAGAVVYYHMLFEAHEIVFANGAPSESLFTGREALKSLPQDALDEIFVLFPQLLGSETPMISARVIPEKGQQVKQLIHRHQKNGHMLLEKSYSLSCAQA